MRLLPSALSVGHYVEPHSNLKIKLFRFKLGFKCYKILKLVSSCRLVVVGFRIYSLVRKMSPVLSYLTSDHQKARSCTLCSRVFENKKQVISYWQSFPYFKITVSSFSLITHLSSNMTL